MTTNLLYVRVRFFEFYGNKCPTVEFIRGWLEYSSTPHCDRENIHRQIEFTIFKNNRQRTKIIFADFDEMFYLICTLFEPNRTLPLSCQFRVCFEVLIEFLLPLLCCKDKDLLQI